MTRPRAVPPAARTLRQTARPPAFPLRPGRGRRLRVAEGFQRREPFGFRLHLHLGEPIRVRQRLRLRERLGLREPFRLDQRLFHFHVIESCRHNTRGRRVIGRSPIAPARRGAGPRPTMPARRAVRTSRARRAPRRRPRLVGPGQRLGSWFERQPRQPAAPSVTASRDVWRRGRRQLQRLTGQGVAESGGKGQGGGKTVVGAHAEGPREHLPEGGRVGGATDRLGAERFGAGGRPLPGEQLQRDGRQGEDVGRGRPRHPLDPLGRRVRDGAVATRNPMCSSACGHADTRQPHLARRHQDVARVEAPVTNAGHGGEVERPRQLANQAQRVGDRRRAVLAQRDVHRLGHEVLLDEEGGAALGAARQRRDHRRVRRGRAWPGGRTRRPARSACSGVMSSGNDLTATVRSVSGS